MSHYEADSPWGMEIEPADSDDFLDSLPIDVVTNAAEVPNLEGLVKELDEQALKSGYDGVIPEAPHQPIITPEFTTLLSLEEMALASEVPHLQELAKKDIAAIPTNAKVLTFTGTRRAAAELHSDQRPSKKVA
jgi:hypothetical protein